MAGEKTNIKFGTSGWRGVVSEDFTYANLRRVASAVASHVKENPEYGFRGSEYAAFLGGKPPPPVPSVVIGYDTRFLSAEFAREVAGVFSANGLRSLLSSESIPTPAVAWAIIHHRAVGGVMITASHNPPEYNGFKWTPFWGGPAVPEITNDIERRVVLVSSASVRCHTMEKAARDGTVQVTDFKPGYLKGLVSLLDLRLLSRSRMKVGVDVMNGAARGYLRPVMERLKMSVIGLREESDVLFGGYSPEPSRQNLAPLRDLILAKRLDLGLACDGDADRFGVMDSNGEWIAPNEILGVVLDHLVRNRNLRGKVVRSVMTSHFVDAVAKFHGLDVRETPVGFKYIGDYLRRGGYLLGGEESAGLSVANHVPEKDGLLACLLVAEAVAAEKKPLTKILESLHKKVGDFLNVRVNFRVRDARQIKKLDEKLRFDPPLEFGGISVRRINQMDGFKFLMRDGSWVGFRSSGTEPVIRLYVEAQSRKRVEKLVDLGERIIKG